MFYNLIILLCTLPIWMELNYRFRRFGDLNLDVMSLINLMLTFMLIWHTDYQENLKMTFRIRDRPIIGETNDQIRYSAFFQRSASAFFCLITNIINILKSTVMQLPPSIYSYTAFTECPTHNAV